MGSINVGRTCGAVESIEAIVEFLSRSMGKWSATFISELDTACRDEVIDLGGGHKLYCHWPGLGSSRMAWLVSCNTVPLITEIFWAGRTGGLCLSNRLQGINTVDVVCMGIHGAHDDALYDNLANLAQGVRKRRRAKTKIVVGDWNIDQLPALANNPWCDSVGREERHHTLRTCLRSLTDALNLELVIPEEVASGPGGPFALEALMAPISRIPT